MAAGVGVAVTAGAALLLTVGSLGWPLVHDAPLLHYVAARLLAGAVPYRDLFDMNFPGVYLVHLLGLALFGQGAAAFRALDLVLLSGTVAGLVVALAPFGRRAAVAGAALFWLYHVAGGAWRAGQRDMILCLPLAWMTAAAFAHLRSGRPLWLGLAGASLGAAVWIKPHALLLLPVLGALAWRVGPDRRRAAACLALGLGLPSAAIVGWLAVEGGLAAFVDIVSGYLVPLYSRLGRERLLGAVLGHDPGVPVTAWLGLWALAGLWALGRGGRLDGRTAVLGAGLGYGIAHFVLQGKGWEYHLYPFALFAIALGAAGLGVAASAGWRGGVMALLIVLGLSTGALAVKGVRGRDPDWIREKAARAQRVAEALVPRVARGRPVQVLDTTGGGIHALYLLGARQPSRFIYDFHFYHDVDRPYVRRLRGELVESLRRDPPAAVVLFERGWPRGDYRRVAGFPELAAWLDGGYWLAVEGDGYRIYAARDDR